MKDQSLHTTQNFLTPETSEVKKKKKKFTNKEKRSRRTKNQTDAFQYWGELEDNGRVFKILRKNYFQLTILDPIKPSIKCTA